MTCPLPENEPARLKALQAYDILDSAPEQAFDDFTQLAATICGTPIATMALIDEHRQWFKAKVGIDAEETSRDVAFCSFVVLESEYLEVQDATKDERFAENPLVVGDPKIRFYAGAPLIDPGGHALGTICAIGQQPHVLDLEQQAALKSLARRIVEQMESRRVAAQLAEALTEIEKLEGMLPICSHCKKIRSDDGHWSTVESFLEARSTTRFTHGICQPCAEENFPDLFDPELVVAPIISRSGSPDVSEVGDGPRDLLA